MRRLKTVVKTELVALAVLSVCFGAYFGPLFVLLFALAVRAKKMELTAWLMLAAYFVFVIPRCMLYTPYLPQINPIELLLNVICIFIICAALYIPLGNLKTAVVTGTLLLVLLSTANAYVYAFRGKELTPSDFLSYETAANVAEQYSFVPSLRILAGWAMWFLTVLLLKQIRVGIMPLKSRFYAAAAIAVSVGILAVGAEGKSIKTWETEGTRLNGYYLNFCIALRDLKIEKPHGYSPAEIEEYSKQYLTEQTGGAKPNIIVIMDESFVDFGNAELKTNVPVTPFLDSLTENTVRGNALTSVYGGNTANAEFEFLTGHSMAFLPDNTVPYQQYINSSIYSLAWYLNSGGYKTVATHPYLKNGWSRPKVYPLLGFSECSFIEDYPRAELMRKYVSDKAMLEYVMDYVSGTEEPLFLFGVTMQNHGGYDYKDFDVTIELDGFDGEYPLAEQYLSLLNETDKAMEYFITELENCGEETVVLFFGDHFPKLEDGFYEELYSTDFSELEDKMKKYTIPFLLWTNYETEAGHVGCTSLNYLSTHLMMTAGLDLPPYNKLLTQVEQKLPAVNALGYYSVEAGGFKPVAAACGIEKEQLELLAQLQYNNMFDKNGRSNVFFGKYIKK